MTEQRIARKISQVVLAESLGYSTFYIGQIERGTANVTCEVMATVSNYFKMTIGQFWTYAEGLSKTSTSHKPVTRTI